MRFSSMLSIIFVPRRYGIDVITIHNDHRMNPHYCIQWIMMDGEYIQQHFLCTIEKYPHHHHHHHHHPCLYRQSHRHRHHHHLRIDLDHYNPK